MTNDEGDPRVPQKKRITVGVFPFSETKPNRFNAYTTWYNSSWKGCCEHTVEAVNGTEAKELAIQEHKDNCNQ
jgi:hypothetical protein